MGREGPRRRMTNTTYSTINKIYKPPEVKRLTYMQYRAHFLNLVSLQQVPQFHLDREKTNKEKKGFKKLNTEWALAKISR